MTPIDDKIPAPLTAPVDNYGEQLRDTVVRAKATVAVVALTPTEVITLRTPTEEDRHRFIERIRALGSERLMPCEVSEADRLLLAMVAERDPTTDDAMTGGDCAYCRRMPEVQPPYQIVHAIDCAWDRGRAYLTTRGLLPVTE